LEIYLLIQQKEATCVASFILTITMKIIVATLIAFVIYSDGVSQQAPQITPNNNVQRYPGGFITALPGPPPGVMGTFYLYDSWNVGSVLVMDDKIIENIPIKLDLRNSLIEIDHDGQTKVLSFDRVKELDLKHLNGTIEHFVNGKTLRFVDTPIEGLFSFIQRGKYNLLSLTRVVEVKPSYNVALDSGSKDYEIVHEELLFIMKDNIVVQVDKSKKKFSGALKKAFGEDFDKKLEKVKVGKEPSLVGFVSSLNSSTM
jgi:hypothetical protein